MRFPLPITLCLLLALSAAPAAAQTGRAFMAASSSDAPLWAKGRPDSNCLETTSTGCIDWSRGYAIGVGFGKGPNRMMAERIAQLIAQRNLLEMIKGVNLDSNTTVKDSALESDVIRTQISGRLQGLVPVDKTRFYSDGSIGVKYKVSLFAMVPEKAYRAKSGPPRELEVPGNPAPGSTLNPGTAYTGLIIDARGTGVRPAMSPKVYDPRGREVYGSAYVSREFATSQGMMGYVKSIQAAKATDRVKGNPAIIKALEAKGANKADLVISQADADALRALYKQQSFLKQSRVMVVLD